MMKGLLASLRNWRGLAGPSARPLPLPVANEGQYAEWVQKYGDLSQRYLEGVVDPASAELGVTIILSGESALSEAFEKSADSIRRQTGVAVELVAATKGDDRWRNAFTRARNRAVGVLSAGDLLDPNAANVLRRALYAFPASPFAYSDEDMIDGEGRRSTPYMKPEWGLDLCLAQDFPCRFALLRSDAASKAAIDGAATPEGALYAALLEAGASRGAPVHAPFVLLHRAPRPLDPAYERECADSANAILQRLFAGGAKVEMNAKSGGRRVVWPLPDPPPMVSAIIPTRDRVDLLKVCVDGLLHETGYSALEVVIVDNDSREQETLDYFRIISANPKVRIVRSPGDFNFSVANNAGAAAASGALIALVNNDIKVRSADWLEKMVRLATRPDVGAVGPLLLYDDETIQHAGCVLGIGGVASHVYKNAPRDHSGHGGRLHHVQEVSAVTAACLLTRREVWDLLGGLDPNLAVAYNDIDFCLRVRQAGLKVLWTPEANLFHLESASRGGDKTGERRARLEAEKAKMVERWNEKLVQDPFYSPNLSLFATDCRLAFPPRDAIHPSGPK